MTGLSESQGTVLIVVPVGKDASLAIKVLQEAGIPAQSCNSVAEATAQLSEGTRALLIAEEALDLSQLPLLLTVLHEQPPWSDIPVIILANSGGSERMSLQAVDLFGPAGNVTILERPLHGVTLVSAMKVALARPAPAIRSARAARATRDRSLRNQRRFFLARSRVALHLRERPGGRIRRIGEGRNARPKHLGTLPGRGRLRVLRAGSSRHAANAASSTASFITRRGNAGSIPAFIRPRKASSFSAPISRNGNATNSWRGSGT